MALYIEQYPTVILLKEEACESQTKILAQNFYQSSKKCSKKYSSVVKKYPANSQRIHPLSHCKFTINCKTFPQVSEIPAAHRERLLIPTTPRNDGASRDDSIARCARRAPGCPSTSVSSFSVTADLSGQSKQSQIQSGTDLWPFCASCFNMNSLVSNSTTLILFLTMN